MSTGAVAPSAPGAESALGFLSNQCTRRDPDAFLLLLLRGGTLGPRDPGEGLTEAPEGGGSGS